MPAQPSSNHQAGEFAGSLSLNWIDNTVEAKVSNIAAPQSVSPAASSASIASDNSTIDSLAGAVAIAGIGARRPRRRSASRSPSTTWAAIPTIRDQQQPGHAPSSRTSPAASRPARSTCRRLHRPDQQHHGGGLGRGGPGTFAALGGAVSINIIHNTSDAYISGSTTTSPHDRTPAPTASTSPPGYLDDSGSGGRRRHRRRPATPGIAVGVSVAVNVIGNTTEAYMRRLHVSSAGDVNLSATSTPTIKALTIGVAVAVTAARRGLRRLRGRGRLGRHGGQHRSAYINNSRRLPRARWRSTCAPPIVPTSRPSPGALGVGVAVGRRRRGRVRRHLGGHQRHPGYRSRLISTTPRSARPGMT